MDVLDNIIAWEQGELGQEETVSFFQELIDTGLAWTLQGCYGRQAMALIENGLCHPAGEPQEEPSDMERETKKKLLVIALDILESAEENATADNPWFYVEHAEHICEVVEVPIKEALGTELWPSYRTAMDVVNKAIDRFSQEGAE